MMRYNLLDTEPPLSSANDDKPIPVRTNGVTVQDYSGTTVTISGIPALEARIHNSVPSGIEKSTKRQM